MKDVYSYAFFVLLALQAHQCNARGQAKLLLVKIVCTTFVMHLLQRDSNPC